MFQMFDLRSHIFHIYWLFKEIPLLKIDFLRTQNQSSFHSFWFCQNVSRTSKHILSLPKFQLSHVRSSISHEKIFSLKKKKVKKKKVMMTIFEGIFSINMTLSQKMKLLILHHYAIFLQKVKKSLPQKHDFSIWGVSLLDSELTIFLPDPHYIVNNIVSSPRNASFGLKIKSHFFLNFFFNHVPQIPVFF